MLDVGVEDPDIQRNPDPVEATPGPADDAQAESPVEEPTTQADAGMDGDSEQVSPEEADGPAKPTDGKVPSWRVRELRQERDALRQQVSVLMETLQRSQPQVQQQAPQPPPGPSKQDAFDTALAQYHETMDPAHLKEAMRLHGEIVKEEALRSVPVGTRDMRMEALLLKQDPRYARYGDLVDAVANELQQHGDPNYMNRETLEHVVRVRAFDAQAPAPARQPAPQIPVTPGRRVVGSAAATQRMAPPRQAQLTADEISALGRIGGPSEGILAMRESRRNPTRPGQGFRVSLEDYEASLAARKRGR